MWGLYPYIMLIVTVHSVRSNLREWDLLTLESHFYASNPQDQLRVAAGV
ncbi:hypothetical protein SAMN05660368_03468 [Marvinbryantia formatexigens]|nr:hypothetical protein SAMN05660368_03468 [Marvinbryantia formatexigens]